MFDIATPADKLISSGLYTVNMLLRAIGEPQVGEEWADTHMMTKNYAGIEEILREMNSTKGGETGGETI